MFSQINEEKRILYGAIVLSIDDITRNLDKIHVLRNEKGRNAGTLFFEKFEVI